MASLNARTALALLAAVVIVGLCAALLSDSRGTGVASGVRGGNARAPSPQPLAGDDAYRSPPLPTAPPGECIAAYGRYTHPWFADRDAMLDALATFLPLYDKRETNKYRRGTGGMRLDHSFAVWYTTKKLQPTAIIESGVYNGHSTWLFRQAMPSARVFALDPDRRKKKGKAAYFEDTSGQTKYFKGDTFVDFAAIDWDAEGIDKSTTLVFIDDHQNAVRRLLEGAMHGFKHFIFEDNYEPLDPRTDFMSIKQACDPAWEHQFPEIKDNFGTVKRKRGAKHAKLWSRVLSTVLDEYYEFPPVVGPSLIPDEKLIYDLAVTTPPLLTNDEAGRARFAELGLPEPRFRDYLGHYGHICYLSIATKDK